MFMFMLIMLINSKIRFRYRFKHNKKKCVNKHVKKHECYVMIIPCNGNKKCISLNIQCLVSWHCI